MSEFSESYHLQSTDIEEGKRLLKRSKLDGYVFPTKQGWVTFVAEPNEFQPQERLIQANEGLLLYYAYGEDHGWYLYIYRNSNLISRYWCAWEDDITVSDEELDRKILYELIEQNTQTKPPVDHNEIEKILHPRGFEDLTNPPAYRLADLIGLPHYRWLSYEYMDSAGDLEEKPIFVSQAD
jgi:hypothetical protein